MVKSRFALVNEMDCDTYEDTSNGDWQICIGGNKMHCDAYDESSDEMKSMMFKGD